jgi:hypothetical protein
MKYLLLIGITLAGVAYGINQVNAGIAPPCERIVLDGQEFSCCWSDKNTKVTCTDPLPLDPK